MSVIIIDYGAGNLGSIANMLKRLGKASKITSDISEISEAKKIILPGVGHFDHGMNMLNSSGVVKILNKRVLEDKVPILGICLGAQLMTKKSEEGTQNGLGWFDAEVLKFKPNDSLLRIPHMGWNYIEVNKKTPLTKDLPDEPRFYFVHSYYMKAKEESDILMTSIYGDSFVSALHKGNIYATQFHPEKSHKFGLKLFQNFLEL